LLQKCILYIENLGHYSVFLVTICKCSSNDTDISQEKFYKQSILNNNINITSVHFKAFSVTGNLLLNYQEPLNENIITTF